MAPTPIPHPPPVMPGGTAQKEDMMKRQGGEWHTVQQGDDPHPTPAQPSPPTASLGSSDLGGNPFSPLFCAGFLDVATPPPPATYLCYQVLGTTLKLPKT